MSCIIIGKWDGKEECKKFLAYFVDLKNENNLMKQLKMLFQNGIIMSDGRVVNVKLFECHDLVATCPLVCHGKVSSMRNNFFPWCTCSKRDKHMVTKENSIQEGDTLSLVEKLHSMSSKLLLVSFIN
jgi:hypothetical protein